MNDKKRLVVKIMLTAILLGLGVLNIFPFLFMVSASFKPNAEIFSYPIKFIPDTIVFHHFVEVFSDEYQFVKWYMNTAIMVAWTIAIKVFIVTMAAYGFAKLKFKGRELLFFILLSAMMVPPESMIVPKYILFKWMGLTDTMWALILPGAFDVFFLFMMRQFFLDIPHSLSEATICDGGGHFTIYAKIVMPLSKAAVITMILFTFIWGWNDYMTPYIFITDTSKQMISVGIKLFQTGKAVDYGAQMTAATLVLLPIIVMFLFAQRYFIEGIATTGVKE